VGAIKNNGDVTGSVSSVSIPSFTGSMAVAYFPPASGNWTAISGGTARINPIGSSAGFVMDASGASNVNFSATNGASPYNAPIALTLK
jgi:hypothetical protein